MAINFAKLKHFTNKIYLLQYIIYQFNGRGGSFKSTNQVYIKNYFQIWFTQHLPKGLLIQIKRLLLTNKSYLSLPVNINSSQRHIMYRYRNQTSLIHSHESEMLCP